MGREREKRRKKRGTITNTTAISSEQHVDCHHPLTVMPTHLSQHTHTLIQVPLQTETDGCALKILSKEGFLKLCGYAVFMDT